MAQKKQRHVSLVDQKEAPCSMYRQRYACTTLEKDERQKDVMTT